MIYLAIKLNIGNIFFMDWFIEKHDGTGFMIRIKKKLYEGKNFQKIEIFDTSMGKMLAIDKKIQFTEADEMFYHEMLVHVPMMMHPSPKKILIIGGGDGGAAREVLKHGVDDVTIVEIDEMVVKKCREYIGLDNGALNDERVSIVYEDGIKFVEKKAGNYDVIIVDGTDPNLISKPLSSKKFYKNAMDIADIFVTQSQSPFFQKDYFKAIIKNSSFLPNRKVYLSFMPSYPSGLWSFMVAGKYELNEEKIKERYKKRKIKTQHYNPSLHMASFALPNWLKEMISK